MSGPTLISLEQEVAKGTGLKIGDTMTLNVLGREIDGAHRQSAQGGFLAPADRISFWFCRPGLIDKAPHSFLATVKIDGPDENRMYLAVTDKFPNISTVRVKDAIAQVDTLLQQLARAFVLPVLSPSWRGFWCWRAPSRRARAPGFMTPPC